MAFLLALGMKPFRRPEAPVEASAAVALRVLVLPRPGLTEDALVVLGTDPSFTILMWPPRIMKALATGFLPDTVDDNRYVGLTSSEEDAKGRYLGFLRRVMAHLLRWARIDAIVSGNFAYFAERELHAAAEALGVPFIVLHKENLKSPARQAYYAEVYRKRRGTFRGRRIIVYNEMEKSVQVAASVAPPERISVCGMPRLDRTHAWRGAHAGEFLAPAPTVLFFYFGPKTGLPVLRRKAKECDRETLAPELESLSWAETVRQTVAAVARFAAQAPHVRVVVKAKQGADVARRWRAAAGAAPPANIEFVEGGDPQNLLAAAWVVVGMNSTALLEAMAMGKRILSPSYAEAGSSAMQAWIADFSGAVERMDAPERLVERLAETCADPAPCVPAELPVAVREQLHRWAGNADGRAAARVRAAIAEEVASTHQDGKPAANSARTAEA